ncbi:hypothetical protein SteCoe_30393 [Stentor coeruleus]|uniref:Anaphase-promoting complex subunit 4 WD40 domain-containing protein n=1 Tax=Stentor coeruleus TaxID=5963 RepID=A0A1R2B3K3_9CILI|nr:hypothetical protein SteCoe_30417 [Stentor coeruleus]OMJ71402.1 hypothetical protein SteCoe_30393 [Stentor coeruleus]
MISQSLLSSIELRETGENLRNLQFSTLSPFLASSDKTRRAIKCFESPYYNLNSEIIWVGGKENILATLNSHGQVVFYDLLNNDKSALLTKSNEHAFKVFFAKENLFIVAKNAFSDYLNFYLIPIENLQNGSDSRITVFEALEVQPKNIKDLDNDNCTMVIETTMEIQVWHILSNSLLKKFPLNPNIHYQFSSGHFIFWEVGKSDTKLGIITLENSSLHQIVIKSACQILICEIIDSCLILGMTNCLLQVINIFTGSSYTISKNIPLAVYKYEACDKLIVRFPDNTFAIISDENIENTERLDLNGEIFFTNIGEFSILSDKTGRVCIITNKVVQVFDNYFDGVQQIGVNPDANQIYFACKGEIFVVD